MSTQFDPTQYIIAPSLEEYYVDKATGLPLSGGWVYFYSDINRTTLKPIYTLSGSPGSYTYTQIPNPMRLTSVGTSSDGMDNDIIIYYKPYDANGNIELYFIQVYADNNDSPGAFQWSRSAWPNIGSGSTDAENVINYVANGQFLLHNNIAATNINPIGRIPASQAITYIAPGGWSFQRPSNSTATDTVTFTQLEPITNPTGNPRYICRIVNTVPASGDAYKNLIIQFPDVNSFSSEDQKYTFAFTGLTNGSGSTNVSFGIYKFFGTGGSTPVTTSGIANFSIASSGYAIYQIPFEFGSNVGKTIGSDNDDYVQLVLSLPTGSLFDISVTDFMLTVGSINITLFPDITNAEMIQDSTLGYLPTPAYDGSNFYLPIILISTGFVFDSSRIGKIYASSTGVVEADELSADGTGYQTNLTNLISGIPYSRIQAKYWNATTQVPRYGTGPTFVTSYISNGNTSQIYLTTNVKGVVTATANGIVSTGFTFANVHTGDASAFGVRSYIANGTFNLTTSAVNSFISTTGAGNSGFTYSALFNEVSTAFNSVKFATLAAAGLSGLYCQFNVTAQKYIWFKVNAAGADPAPGGTGIEVDLLSTDTAQDVAMKCASASAGFQSSTIITQAASGMTAGCYFSFNTATQLYVVWYKINNVGDEPVVANALYLQVTLTGSETAAQVASKTQAIINAYYVAVPDLRGLTLRGYDPTPNWDPDTATRFSQFNYTLYGNQIGDLELFQYYAHHHGGSTINLNFESTSVQLTGNNINTSTTAPPTTLNITDDGGNEVRSVNITVLYVIKY